jgi:uncharacterized protein
MPSLSEASLPVFEVGLNALSASLDKAAAFAEAKKIDGAVLLGWRLAPDMFALVRQVRAAADQAKNGASRLAGIDPPRFEDEEATIDQLQARLEKTLVFLKTVDPRAIDAAVDREVTFPLGPIKQGHMQGADYLHHFVLPNFHFHRTAAHAILRACGVEIGKLDFIGAIPIRIT